MVGHDSQHARGILGRLRIDMLNACNERFLNGTPHLYTDGVFATDADYCETYGFDMTTGGAVTPEKYKANDHKGKAFIWPIDYEPPHEVPDDTFPLWLTTGRLVYRFHTRTKTGRSKELYDAAPDAFVQLAEDDAVRYGIAEGD